MEKIGILLLNGKIGILFPNGNIGILFPNGKVEILTCEKYHGEISIPISRRAIWDRTVSRTTHTHTHTHTHARTHAHTYAHTRTHAHTHAHTHTHRFISRWDILRVFTYFLKSNNDTQNGLRWVWSVLVKGNQAWVFGTHTQILPGYLAVAQKGKLPGPILNWFTILQITCLNLYKVQIRLSQMIPNCIPHYDLLYKAHVRLSQMIPNCIPHLRAIWYWTSKLLDWSNNYMESLFQHI